MRDSKNNIQRLLDRINSGVATDKEIEDYNRWCDAFQKDRVEESDTGEVHEDILVDVKNKINFNEKHLKIISWFKIAVAATIVLALTFGGYYFFSIHFFQPTGIVQEQPSDISPGTNKAVLTLTNGQTIILSNAQNGQLTLQGNSRITKIDNGVLAYENIKQKGNPANNQSVLYNELSVPKGGTYQMVLPDGTKVWLNSASSIRFPTAFVGKYRKVRVSGEAYFEVAKDPDQPFIVETHDTKITVLGTDFNVMAYENESEVKTTLLDGVVKAEIPNSQKGILLKPGQQASINKGSQDINVEKVDAADAAAWIHGFLSLNEYSVQELMNKLSRWYDVKVEYKGGVPKQKFGGLINRNTNLSDVLSALKVAGISTEFKHHKIIVLPD